jgi:hypothetical protein
MSKARYSAQTGAAVALSAATAKTVLAVIAPAQFGCDLVGYEVAFDGAMPAAAGWRTTRPGSAARCGR